MADHELVARFRDYFVRQTAWLERVLQEVETAEGDLEEPNLDRVTERQTGYAEDAAGFEREFWTLTEAWQKATDVSPADREMIRGMAQRAEVLARRLSAIQEQAQQAVSTRADSLTSAWNALRRGRVLLRKYRVADSSEGSFVDRKS